MISDEHPSSARRASFCSTTSRCRGSSKRPNVGINVTNLFDQDTVTRLFTTPYRDSLNISDAAFFAGFNAIAVAKATTAIRPDPRFGLPDQWQSRRTARLQVKFVF